MNMRFQDLTQPSERDIQEAILASNALSTFLAKGKVDHIEIETRIEALKASTAVPAKVFELILEILGQMANGNMVTVVPIHAELTTQQAADILNVSRPYVVKLIEDGHLPAKKVGTHRRIRMSDLIIYKKYDDKERREVLRELTREAQELGLGYNQQ